MFKDINLLPDRILYRKRLFFINLGKVLGVAALILGLAALVLIKPYQHWEMQKRAAQLAASLEAPEFKELDELENRLADIKKEYSELEAVVGKIPSRRIKTTDLLMRISCHMPASITATDIVFEPEIRQLTITLSTARRQDIPLLLKRLHNDQLFEDVNISEIRGVENQYRFSAMLKLK